MMSQEIHELYLVQDCCFHPTEMLAAVGLIDGRVQAFRLTSAEDPRSATAVEAVSKKAHKESCRAVRFTADGAKLLTASTDRCPAHLPSCNQIFAA